MHDKPSVTLAKIIELYSRPGTWMRGSFAADRNGKEVSYDSADACCFCMAGALLHFNAGAETSEYIRNAVANADNIVTYNDSLSHRYEALSWARRAYAHAVEDGQ